MGDNSTAQTLLQMGVDANVLDDAGRTPLACAIDGIQTGGEKMMDYALILKALGERGAYV